MATSYDDHEEVALVNQRYFSAGIKRRRIEFVPSSSSMVAISSLPAKPAQSAADQYLSIVFNKAEASSKPADQQRRDNGVIVDGNDEESVNQGSQAAPPMCEICHLSITTGEAAAKHESSIAHQICLQHSHPPSHLDRRRKGLAVLESQGWDPDSRRGLGAEGEGRLYPVKAKENPERAGLGHDPQKQPANVVKPVKLDAGKIRLREQEAKKKAAKLRDAFYRSDDMEKYLGAEGERHASLDLKAFKRAKRR